MVTVNQQGQLFFQHIAAPPNAQTARLPKPFASETKARNASQNKHHYDAPSRYCRPSRRSLQTRFRPWLKQIRSRLISWKPAEPCVSHLANVATSLMSDWATVSHPPAISTRSPLSAFEAALVIACAGFSNVVRLPLLLTQGQQTAQSCEGHVATRSPAACPALRRFTNGPHEGGRLSDALRGKPLRMGGCNGCARLDESPRREVLVAICLGLVIIFDGC